MNQQGIMLTKRIYSQKAMRSTWTLLSSQALLGLLQH